jgi:hypothetical protein
MQAISWVAEQLLTSEEGLYSMELVGKVGLNLFFVIYNIHM